jgi:cellulose biosynthesis protein BcsQ
MEQCKVFTMASAKGGSGKTLLTASFATFLSALNKKVLIIDSDSTTNGLTLMYLKEVLIEKEITHSKSKTPSGLFDFKDGALSRMTKVNLNNGVSLIPATFRFDNLKDNFREIHREYVTHRLSNLILQARSEYDFVFIDAQAGSDHFAEIAISRNISDEVIIVSEYDPLSAAGVERLKGIFREDLTYNRTWYLLNKMIPEFIQSFSDFLEIAKYLNPIPWDSDVVKAYARRKLPIDLENGNEFTIAIIQTLKTLLGDEMSIEIETWKKEKESIFKEPITKHYHYLQEKLREIEYNDRRKKYLKNLTFTLTVIVSVVIISTIYFYLEQFDMTYLKIALGVIGTSIIFFIPRYHVEKDDYLKNIEKDVILDQLKKFESLKYSNFDTIVRDRKSSKTNIMANRD